MSRSQRILVSLVVAVLLPVSVVTALAFSSGFPGGDDEMNARQRVSEQLERWRKLDAGGEPVAVHQGPWACVEDVGEKLIWEVKSWQEYTHYYKSSYSWRHQETGEKDLGSCVFGKQFVPCDTEDLIQRLNQARYCGVTSWRLPTYDELKSLADPETVAGQPMINRYLFPRTARGPYWTSTLEPGAELNIWTYDFYQGSGKPLPPHIAGWARLVSSKNQ
ncbi:hypothetical protein BTA51_09705 [Hahella sp. CCB-MM4]|uniref:Lcl C-terminal domain-containing protein n=1 Tax=Hahella sp. (strain CCB-MM4) TaxID=1926491 RepID=UPI000B9ABE90|nr:DUF1566 domain-containing protein [Hahella sp. CCB-MM4]OZG74037.1 hypothetical protein BTA51_09705 [Hahella sp. CCB-MM4]